MKLAYRSPRIFRHGGWFLRVWGKWYRIIKVEERQPDRWPRL